jgi:ABC-type maltose transport system permease subunit
MEHTSLLERVLRGIALTLVVIFFMFPIVWILMMSFQTNETILRIPPQLVFKPTLANYTALITGKLTTAAGTLDIAFMRNLRRPTPLHGISFAARKTLPLRCCRSGSRPRCWYSCRSPSISRSLDWPTPISG